MPLMINEDKAKKVLLADEQIKTVKVTDDIVFSAEQIILDNGIWQVDNAFTGSAGKDDSEISFADDAIHLYDYTYPAAGIEGSAYFRTKNVIDCTGYDVLEITCKGNHNGSTSTNNIKVGIEDPNDDFEFLSWQYVRGNDYAVYEFDVSDYSSITVMFNNETWYATNNIYVRKIMLK